MKKITLFFSTIILFGALQSPLAAAIYDGDINVWKILAMVSMTKKFDEEMGIDVDMPTYSKAVKKLNNTEITIKGYVLPLRASKNHKYFVLSAYPYNRCYFCGGAGPESVMEAFSTEAVKPTKNIIKLKGTLKINYNPTFGEVLYSLKNAKAVK